MKTEDIRKHILFVEGAGQSLVKAGLLQGPVSMLPKGIAAYDQLMASGWKPQRHAVRRLLQDKGVPEAQLEMTVALFMKVAEHPEGTV